MNAQARLLNFNGNIMSKRAKRGNLVLAALLIAAVALAIFIFWSW